jgi:predicted glycosyltransferase
MRFLFYSHDGTGPGQTRRHLAIIAELAPDASVMLTGADGVHRLGLSQNVEVLKLPVLRKVLSDQYASRHNVALERGLFFRPRREPAVAS